MPSRDTPSKASSLVPAIPSPLLTVQNQCQDCHERDSRESGDACESTQTPWRWSQLIFGQASRITDGTLRTSLKLRCTMIERLKIFGMAGIRQGALSFLLSAGGNHRHLNLCGCAGVTDHSVDTFLQHCSMLEHLSLFSTSSLTATVFCAADKKHHFLNQTTKPRVCRVAKRALPGPARREECARRGGTKPVDLWSQPEALADEKHEGEDAGISDSRQA